MAQSRMDIIPVIDLRGGLVVRARMGRREEYRPIETPLAATSDPVDVARGLLSLHRFAAIYVADLDAIEKTGDNTRALARLRTLGIPLWVDNGTAEGEDAARWLAEDLGDLVIGSESQTDAALMRQLAGEPRILLSLDFRGDAFAGPAELLADPTPWPRRVIVMTLARVGSGAGPDLDRLSMIVARAPDRRVYAAGGVRGPGDLAELRRSGVAGALVASCLHDGRLTAAEIAAA
jgi:phosphoribosylformimino-5-aminoimidazole carboxamide ribotide isomerase